MLFQRINRSDPEKIFIVVRNDYTTAALSAGQVVMWNYAATTPDGVGVTRPAARGTTFTNKSISTAGCVAENINSASYGLLQVYGYQSALRVRRRTSAGSIAKGGPLWVNAAGSVFCAESATTTDNIAGLMPMAFALQSYTTWATTTIPAFIKAL